jgi:hypothetical protein
MLICANEEVDEEVAYPACGTESARRGTCGEALGWDCQTTSVCDIAGPSVMTPSFYTSCCEMFAQTNSATRSGDIVVP